MIHTQSNLIYHTELDGIFLKYQLKGWLGSLCLLLGFCKYFELPLNVILDYEIQRRFFVFECFRFTIYSHNHLSKYKLKTYEIRGLLFMSSKTSSFTKRLQESLDENIKETSNGNNLGVLNVPIEIIAC